MISPSTISNHFVLHISNSTERIIIVSEYVGNPLSEVAVSDFEDILKICYQIASALNYIHSNGFVVQNLEPKNILLDEWFNVKLFNYGLFYQTNSGEYVTFPIGYIQILYLFYLLFVYHYFSIYVFNY